MTSSIQLTGVDTIRRNMEIYQQRVMDTCRAIAEYFAPIVESEAKENAPWQDRTGNARQGLAGLVEDISASVVALHLIHGMDYGVWLELKNSGRYAIILPTMEAHYQDVIDTLRKALK